MLKWTAISRILTVFVILAIGSCPTFALQTVAQSGGADHTTIASALAAAAPGEEVRVIDQATYNENLDLNNVMLTSVPAGAVITGASSRNGMVLGLTMVGEADVTLQGFTLIPSAPVGRAIHCWGTGARNIKDVTIIGTHGIELGVYLYSPLTLNLTNTVIHDVIFDTLTVDSPEANGATINVSNCDFYNFGRFGFYCANSVVLNMTDTVIHNGSGGHGINIDAGGSGAPGVGTKINLTRCEIHHPGIHCFVLGGGIQEGVESTFTDCNIHDAVSGHGIVQLNDSTITLKNTTIHNNFYEAVAMDGATAEDSGFNLILDHVTIKDNGRHGIGSFRTSHISISDSVISGNGQPALGGPTGFGLVYGTQYAAGGSVTFERSQFVNNFYGFNVSDVVRTSSPVTTEISQSIFTDGSGGNTLLASVGDGAEGSQIVNNLFDGGAVGLTVNESNIRVYHNTIVNAPRGLNLALGGGNPISVENNIIDQAADYGVASSGGSGFANLTLDYNLVNGATSAFDSVLAPLAGIHNITGTVAGFSSPSSTIGAGEYTLTSGSPALNSGTNVGVSFDLNGNTRPQGIAPDMGAYEGVATRVDDWRLY